MSTEITLTADKRDVLGKKVKHLRTEGKLPAVLQDRGKDSVNIVVDAREFHKVFTDAGKHHTIKVNIAEGKTYSTLIKDVDYKVATQIPVHVVFQALNAKDKVTTEVPLRLVGDAPAEKASLQVIHQHSVVVIEALPKDLIDELTVDAISLVEAGDKITVGDIVAPKGVEIKTEPEQVIASVETPKDQAAEADASADSLADDAGGEAATVENSDTEQEATATEKSAE